MAKRKNAKILGVISIVVSLMGIAHKGMYGGRAGWEIMLPIVGTGALLAIIALGIKRMPISWVALIVALLGVLMFFLY